MADSDDELQAELTLSAEPLAVALLGEPNKKVSDKKRMRWGNKGSMALALHGAKRGSWFDHEAGYGGGPLQLIVHARRCGYPEAKEWARDWLGMPEAERASHAGAHQVKALLARQADANGPDADEQQRIATARGLWAASVPVRDTLGERAT